MNTVRTTSITHALDELNMDASMRTHLEGLILKYETEVKGEEASLVKMPFGKHKGKTLYDIAQEDYNYIKYLLKTDYVKESFEDIYQAALLFKR